MRTQRRDIKEETVGYTLQMPEDLYERIRRYAFENRQSIAWIMETSIRQYLEQHEQGDNGGRRN